jgi:hypothetical protein
VARDQKIAELTRELDGIRKAQPGGFGGTGAGGAPATTGSHEADARQIQFA